MAGQTPDEFKVQAARRAERDPFFLAWALAVYRRDEAMNNDTLAAFLGCDLDTLPSLALCGRPETGSPTFGRDADEIARAFGVSTLQLVRLLRRVDANTAVRGAGAPDILTAARDRDEGEDASGEADRARDD